LLDAFHFVMKPYKSQNDKISKELTFGK